MTTDFEIKLKENLIKDIDATNVDCLSEIMKKPFEEAPKKRSFFNIPKRAVATIFASVFLLCVGIFASDGFLSQESNQPMPMSIGDMSRSLESATINISEGLQEVMLDCEMEDTIEVAVLTSVREKDFVALSKLERELVSDDFASFNNVEQYVLITKLEKSDIINMKNHFYFMLESEVE